MMDYYRGRFIAALNEEGDIQIRGVSWPRYDVLTKMDATEADAVFHDWVADQKQASIARATEFLRRYGCLQRFRKLIARHKQAAVLPFVGAGMSIASGFKDWGAFLIGLLSDAPQAADAVTALIAAGEFEDAAQTALDILGPDVFAEEISNELGSHHSRIVGPVELFPHIFRNGVFTTNFDYILPTVYTAAKSDFSNIICGEQLKHAAKVQSNNSHVLIRLHGEADVAAGRVLTKSEYQAVYGETDLLKRTMAQLIGYRSLLFVGCSLTTDRTFSTLAQIRADTPGEPIPHYAFLPYPGDSKRSERRQQLAAASIHPIYYPPGSHDISIEDLLIALAEGRIDG